MYSVLLVDDEPSVLTGLRYVIDWDEYGVEIAGTASNGTQALELLRELPVDILITDIQMPQMGGLELLQQVRAQNMDLRCIILTGYDDFKYVKKAAQLGIENYLLKPVSPEELSETPRRHLFPLDHRPHRQRRADRPLRHARLYAGHQRLYRHAAPNGRRMGADRCRLPPQARGYSRGWHSGGDAHPRLFRFF